jgi:hypothetical protein
MKERYAEAIKLPTAPERQKSVYLGPMGNENFPDDWKSNNKIMLDIKTGIDGLNQKLSPQP